MARRRVSVDTIQLDIEVNGKKLVNEYKELSRQAAILHQKQLKLKIGSKEWIAENEKLNLVRQRLADARKVARGLGQDQGFLAKATQAFGGIANKVFSPLGGLIAGLSVAGFAKQLLDTATKLETFSQKSKAVFGEAIRDVEAFAARNASALGLTQKEYIAAATQAGDLLIPMGFQREEAAKLSNDLIGLSGALAEWNNVQGGSTAVSNILTKALLGEREQLKSLGIAINEAEVKGRLLEKGQAKLTGQALQQAKAQATLELIYEKSTDAQDAFAKNGNSLARQQAQISAAFRDITATLAQKLIPVFSKVLGFVSRLIGANKSLSESMNDQRIAMNSLVLQVTAYDEGTEEWSRLLDKLNTQFPEFLENLDKETVTNRQLAQRLKEVNEQLINKIVIQKKQEEIEAFVQKTAEKRLEAEEKTNEINEKLEIISRRRGVALLEEGTAAERVIDLREKLSKLDKGTSSGFLAQTPIDNEIRSLENTLIFLNRYREEEQELLNATNQLTSEKTSLMKRLGVTLDDLTDSTTSQNTTSTASNTTTQKSNELRRLQIELLEDEEQKRIALLRLQAEEKAEKVTGSEGEKNEKRVLIERKLFQDIAEVRAEFEQKRRDQLAERIELETEAQRSIQRLAIEVLEDGEEKRVAILRTEAEERISKLTGTEETIAQQTLLIRQKLNRDVARVRSNALQERISELRTEAAQEAEALTGTAEEINTQRLAIEQRLQTAITTVIESHAQEQIRLTREFSELREEALIQGTQSTLANQENLAAELTRIETDTQAQIQAIRADNTLTEAQVEERIQAVERAASLERNLVISTQESIARELVRIETETAQQIKQVRAENLESTEEATTIEAIRAKAERKKEVITTVNTQLAQELIRIEREAQTQINAIKADTKPEDLQAKVEAIQAEAELKRQVAISSQTEISNILVRIEEETQAKIQAIKAQGLEENDQESAIAEVRILALEEKAVVISAAETTLQERLAIEQQQTADVVRIKTEALKRIQSEEKQSNQQSLSETEKAFQEKLKILQTQQQQEQLLEAQGAVKQAAGGASPEDIEQALRDKLLKIQLAFLQQKKELQDSFGLSTLETEQQIADAELDIARKKVAGLNSIEQERIQKVVQAASQAAGIVGQLFDLEANANRKRSQEQLDALEKRKQKELELAGSNTKKKRQIEEAYAKKEEEIRTQAARKERELALKKAAIDVALSVIKAGASAAFPLNLPAIGYALGQGAAQIAIIASQSFARGGYTGKAQKGILPDETGERPVGVVHEMEWVANKRMVKDPVMGPIIQKLDRIQRGGFQRIGSSPILSKVAPSVSPIKLKGLADGGFSTEVPVVSPSDEVINLVAQPGSNGNLEAKLDQVIAAIMGIELKIGEYEADRIKDLQDDLAKRLKNQGAG